ncbi:hypothetical protein, partial [Staphylococcus aureus]
HIDRGYSLLEKKLEGLGATIWREKLNDQEIEELQNS